MDAVTGRLLPGVVLLFWLVAMILAGPRVVRSVIAGVLGARAPASGAVYSFTQLKAALVHDPEAWIGRAVRVRAVADYCLSWTQLGDGDARNICSSRVTVLRDPSRPGSTIHLPLRLAPETALLATLRRVPGAAALLPAAQTPWWGVPQIYTVRLDRASGDGCMNTTNCVAAVLLDTDPAALLSAQLV
jgi:hypothetical protein